MPENDPGVQPRKCQRCQVHDASASVADSWMDYSHGFSERWCDCCIAEKNVLHAEEQAAALPELRSRLAAACDSSGHAPPEIRQGWCVVEQVHRSVRAGVRRIFWAEDMGALIDWMKANPEPPGTTRAVACRCRRPEGLQPDGTVKA